MVFRFLISLNPIRKCCFSRASTSQSRSNLLKICFVDRGDFYSGNAIHHIQRRWHGGVHNHFHEDRDSRSGEDSENIFRIGLAADVGLAVGKAVTGYLSGSPAIIADAAHSVSDVVLSGVALLSFKAARTPKDKEHPYGHGKFESLGALGISGMLLVTAGGIAWHAFDVLQELWFINHSLAHDSGHIHHRGHQHGIDMDHPVLALNMTLISIAVKEGLYWMTKRVGERTGSGLMIANAWHHRSDAVSSVVALLGVGGSILGVGMLDPIAGLLVSGLILKAGFESGYHSILELVDAAVPSNHLEVYKETIMGVPGVKGHKHLRGRRAGSSLYLDVDVEVDPFSSVSEAHDIGEDVRHQVQQSHPEVAEVFIHIEPENSHAGESDINQQKSSTSECCNISLEPADVEETVSKILVSNFSQKMEVQKITRHSPQGHIYLEIEVTMCRDTLIREAAKVAENARKCVVEAVPNIKRVSILLRLSQPLPDL